MSTTKGVYKNMLIPKHLFKSHLLSALPIYIWKQAPLFNKKEKIMFYCPPSNKRNIKENTETTCHCPFYRILLPNPSEFTIQGSTLRRFLRNFHMIHGLITLLPRFLDFPPIGGLLIWKENPTSMTAVKVMRL